MGSEIVSLFTPFCVGALVYLGYLTSKKAFRVAAILCLFVSCIFSAIAVSIVPSYSFWTQAGFFSFAFLLAAVIALPNLLLLTRMVAGRTLKS